MCGSHRRAHGRSDASLDLISRTAREHLNRESHWATGSGDTMHHESNDNGGLASPLYLSVLFCIKDGGRGLRVPSPLLSKTDT